MEEIIFEIFNISENSIISVKLAKVWDGERKEGRKERKEGRKERKEGRKGLLNPHHL
jgi:hypothetical protein